MDGGETRMSISIGGRCVRHHPSEGLRILIHHKEQATNVVIKAKMMMMMMMTRKLVSQACHLPEGLPELDFLKSCFLCRRELSPCKDVYMYRFESAKHSLDSTCEVTSCQEQVASQIKHHDGEIKDFVAKSVDLAKFFLMRGERVRGQRESDQRYLIVDEPLVGFMDQIEMGGF